MNTKKLDIWMKFFLLCDHERNTLGLAKYYYSQFILYPQERDIFLENIQKLITDEKDKGTSLLYIKKYMSCLCEIFERFGLYKKKCALDDLYLSLTDPDAYKKIKQDIQDALGKYEKDITTTLSELKKISNQMHIACEIKYRVKNIYSIYQKMQRLQMDDIKKIKDLIGFRMIVTSNNPDDCYRLLAQIHDRYTPVIHSFKDYIQIPKINGYQSIHTGVRGLWSKPATHVEIQIKTQQMERDSMEGGSSHLSYKLSGGESCKKVVLGIQYEALISHEQKYCNILTRDNDLYELPRGTRVLDFASRVHSSIALRLMGAQINEEFCEISTLLAEGDLVELLTHPTKRQIAESWLKIPQLQKRSRKHIHAKTR